jgi:DNA-binding HxlR family transcriptional regulator
VALGERGYGQFCPIAMATEVLGRRWTLLILRELLCGSTRFNDIRRGVPRISPALLTKRLRELESAGLVNREPDDGTGAPGYRLTEAGEELRPLVLGLGRWGQRWLEAQLSPENLDPALLMWDMRRNLAPAPLPRRRITIQFHYRGVARGQRATWWLVVDGRRRESESAVDLCMIDPGFDVDLYVLSDLRTMTAIWMGLTTLREAVDTGRLEIAGDRELRSNMQKWLGSSLFAGERKRVPP